MRVDPDCRDPDLLAAEVRRLRAVIDSGAPTLTDAEREAIGLSIPAMQYAADELGLSSAEFDGHADTLRGLMSKVGSPKGKVGSPKRQSREAEAQSREAAAIDSGQPVLTEEEREAIERAIAAQEHRAADMHPRSWIAADIDDDCDTLRGLLERTGRA